MTVSLTPAGSAAVPRSAAAWLRGPALAALGGAADSVQAARASATDGFTGLAGRAHGNHANVLTLHLLGLRERVSRAAGVIEAYAARLDAHESLLADVRRRALAAGLQVTGDQLVAPSDPTDLVASTRWSDLATEVLHEHRALGEWVHVHLEGAVASFQDDETARYVLDFLDRHRHTIAAGALSTAASARQLNRLEEAHRVARQTKSRNKAVAAEGRRAIEAGEVRALKETADRFGQLAKVPGPVGIAADTYLALESDEPSDGIMAVLGGTTAGTGVALTMAAMAPAAPVLLTGGLVTVFAIGGAEAGQRLWGQLPEEMQESADEILEDAWEGVKDVGEAAWDGLKGWTH